MLKEKKHLFICNLFLLTLFLYYFFFCLQTQFMINFFENIEENSLSKIFLFCDNLQFSS